MKKTIKKAKKLTKVETERVAVLKDAIAQLRLKIYKASGGGYVRLRGDEPDWEELVRAQDVLQTAGIKLNLVNTEVQKLLPNLVSKAKPCKVCAKGALAISAIKKFNNLSIGELADSYDLDSAADFKAQEFFGEENADRMERFYESWTEKATTVEEINQIREWVKKYGYHTDKMLIAIYTNAIANNGIFKP